MTGGAPSPASFEPAMDHSNDPVWIAAFRLTEAATAVTLMSEREQADLFVRATNRDPSLSRRSVPGSACPARARIDMTDERRIEERLEKIEELLAVLVERQQVREWYTTEQVAQLVRKAEFTVREWCRNGRLKAEKRMSGRGAYPAWVISHAELLRYQREGLLPLRRPA